MTSLLILIISGVMSIVGFIILFEDIQRRKGWHEYLLDACIIMSGAATFTWTMMHYAN